MNGSIQEIFSSIVSEELQEKLFPIKVVFIAISFLLTVLILYLLRITTWWKALYGRAITEITTYKTFEAQALAKKWERIRKRIETATPSEAKLALIEVDNLLDEVLERMGYRGETLGERLKQLAPNTISNLDALWGAHRVRNNIVHDPDYDLSLKEAKKTINVYSQTFKDLGVF